MLLKVVVFATFSVCCSVGVVQFEIVNREPGPIWIGIRGNQEQPHLENGGFRLEQGKTKIVEAPDDWSGTIWPRTWCDNNTNTCLTGDCAHELECAGKKGFPPLTLIEITLKDWKGLDYYGISLVQGFNLRAIIQPIRGRGDDGNKFSCARVACTADINTKCVHDLRRDHNGQNIGCYSACDRFDTDQYCCRGRHDRPETCRSSNWPQDYAAFFKTECPQAYSYVFDQRKDTFTCNSSYYRIQFGVH